MKRVTPSIKQRLTPCICCGFPLSERHHLLGFADYGENNYTIQLCPNCHSLYHLIHAAYIEESPKAKRVIGEVFLKLGLGNDRTSFLMAKVYEAEEVRKHLDKLLMEIARKESNNAV